MDVCHLSIGMSTATNDIRLMAATKTWYYETDHVVLLNEFGQLQKRYPGSSAWWSTTNLYKPTRINLKIPWNEKPPCLPNVGSPKCELIHCRSFSNFSKSSQWRCHCANIKTGKRCKRPRFKEFLQCRLHFGNFH